MTAKIASNKMEFVKLPFYLFFIFLFLLWARPIFASGFQLKTIGSLNVDGVTYNHLWYSNGNVTFTGVAPAGAQITATIDSNNQTVTADASGNWSFSTTLTNGDHTIAFSSSSGNLSFTLTIGEVPADVGSLPAAQTPTAGTTEPTVLLFGGGLGLLFTGLLFKSKLFLS